jgi:hypothetical protein
MAAQLSSKELQQLVQDIALELQRDNALVSRTPDVDLHTNVRMLEPIVAGQRSLRVSRVSSLVFGLVTFLYRW